MKLTIATCDFPVAGSVRRNLGHVLRQMRAARARGADVVHFPETCLSGYAGIEFPSFKGYDWALLESCTRRVLAQARELKAWVILGSSHRLSGAHKPHNSLYIIDARGRIVDRYDKMFCTGDRTARGGDLAHYAPGSHLPLFRIKGIACGAQICHDFRYQELYREYRRMGAQVIFHSYHNAHLAAAKWRKARAAVGAHRRLNPGATIHGAIVPPTMQAYAANNYFWISVNNSSARESMWPGFVVRPDGVIAGRLVRNRAGILVTTIDTGKPYYDASAEWRDRAMRGTYHSGTLVRDPRSRRRREL